MKKILLITFALSSQMAFSSSLIQDFSLKNFGNNFGTVTNADGFVANCNVSIEYRRNKGFSIYYKRWAVGDSIREVAASGEPINLEDAVVHETTGTMELQNAKLVYEVGTLKLRTLTFRDSEICAVP
jgi:hypothetical protein